MASEETDIKSTTVEEIIKELNSSSGRAFGPSKTVMGVTFVAKMEDLSGTSLKGNLTVQASYEGLHQDDWDGERVFEVTQSDIETLARTTPRYKPDFEKFAEEFNRNAAEWQKRRSRVVKEISAMFGSGLRTKTHVPKTARFNKKR